MWLVDDVLLSRCLACTMFLFLNCYLSCYNVNLRKILTVSDFVNGRFCSRLFSRQSRRGAFFVAIVTWCALLVDGDCTTICCHCRRYQALQFLLFHARQEGFQICHAMLCFLIRPPSHVLLSFISSNMIRFYIPYLMCPARLFYSPGSGLSSINDFGWYVELRNVGLVQLRVCRFPFLSTRNLSISCSYLHFDGTWGLGDVAASSILVLPPLGAFGFRASRRRVFIFFIGFPLTN